MTHLRRFKQNNEGCLSNLITSFVKVFVLQCKILHLDFCRKLFYWIYSSATLFEISYLRLAIEVIFETRWHDCSNSIVGRGNTSIKVQCLATLYYWLGSTAWQWWHNFEDRILHFSHNNSNQRLSDQFKVNSKMREQYYNQHTSGSINQQCWTSWRDCRKDERHEDGSIDQQYGTSYITNNEFVTQMEVSANSAEFPEVKMDFKFILWTLKIHAYLSQHNEVSTTQNEASNYNKPYYSFAILHVNVRWKGWVKTLPFSFCT